MSTNNLDKNQLLQSIKTWLHIDNEMIELQKAIKERRKMKKELTQNLVNVMRDNEIDCFDVKDGQLYYKRSVVKKPVNKKVLLSTLSDYFKNDTDPTKAQELCKIILDNREETVRETIQRKIQK